MGLGMASLWKHPKTGVLWFRRSIPRDLQRAESRLAVLGVKLPTIAQRSLKTKDEAIARPRWAEENERWEERFANWRQLLSEGEPRRLSQKECWALAGEWAAGLLAKYGDNPGDRRTWADFIEVYRGFRLAGQHGEAMAFEQMGREVRMFLAAKGLVIDEPSRQMLLRAFMDDFLRACEKLLAMLGEGDYSEPAWLAGRPRFEGEGEKPSSPSSSSEVTFEQLLERWQQERAPAESTVATYKTRIKGLTRRLGHAVASRVTRADMQQWKTDMLAAGLEAKTINENLRTASTLFRVGMRADLVAGDPAADLQVRRKAKEKSRREFTDEEARLILAAARDETGFLRWAPWVLAYTGARVGEVAQLRKIDVRDDEKAGGWTIDVTRAAGTVKTIAGERRIPAHPVLIEEGFGEFVRQCMTERLFPELYRDGPRGKERTAEGVRKYSSDLMRKWLRGKLKIADLKLGPSHSWRHLFSTLCRDAGVDKEARKAIVGHAAGDVSEAYGSHRVRALRREIEKIKPLQI